MKPFRIRTVRTTTAAGLALIAVIIAERPLRASQTEPLLQPTPLVLKDGRIASVSIHVLPFAPGRAELGGQAEARVAELTRAVATDCFLTAQVIGHIDSNEVAQDDTLNAHRLARSRADAVQASLIGGGLPAKAIASVWDWQFMVRAPRVTVWIFQLTAGEDCEGRPLDGALVAQTAPSSPRAAAPAERTPTTAARAPVAQAGESARPPGPAAARPKAEPPQVRAAAPGATPASPAAQPERSTHAQSAEQRETGTNVAARPALAPRAPASDAKVEQPVSQRQTGATATVQPAPAPRDPASDGRPGHRAERPNTGSAVAAKSAEGSGKLEQPAQRAASGTAVAGNAASATNAATGDGNLDQAAQRPETGTAVAGNAASAAKSEGAGGKVEQPSKRPDSGTAVAANAPSTTNAAGGDGKVERSPEGGLVITFATNSSYFPSGATRRLRQLVAGLDPENRYEVGLKIAVSGSTKVVGARSPQEAARYNKWLAERRLERVQNWFLENAATDALTFKPEYVIDESRQVVVQLAPVG